jgi:alkanesulfonate monooxygenase
MPVDFIGIIGTRAGSEIQPPTGPIVDRVHLATIARAHEYAGFDMVYAGYHSNSPDNFQAIAYVAQQTERLRYLIAHRPGFLPPTIAAKNLATLDHFTDGKLAVNIISGDDADFQREGDFLPPEERYHRAGEFLDVVKTYWTSPVPFDHEGKYFRVKNSLAAVQPLQKPHIPIFFPGTSDVAIDVAARHADVYALWGEEVEEVRAIVNKVRAAAKAYGRENHIRFSLSLRPVLAATEAAAWARAEDILARAKALSNSVQAFPPTGRRPGGMQRLRDLAGKARIVDKRLWTEMAGLPNARGNTTGLVGTAEQVAESLLDYYDAGISVFLIRGFEPIEDALEYGKELLPLVRAAVAERDARARPALAATG